jgi:GSCFA family
MSAGSCFASNVRRYIEAAGLPYTVAERPHPLFAAVAQDGLYDAFSARYGNVYTARQMAQLLDRVLGAFSPEENRWIDNGTWIDPFRPGLKHRARSDREFDFLTAQHLAAVRRAVEESSVFIFTLGLTEAWVSRADGAVFPACPGTVSGEFDPDRHEFHNFSVEEVIGDLHRLVTGARAINPSLKVILTVSPVPLVATATGRHVLVATTYSKSVLRVAADVAARSLPDVAYFPAYELVTGPQAAYETFQPDRRNVTEAAVEGVMAAFFATFMEPDTVPSPVVPRAGGDPATDAERAALGLRDALTTVVAAQCEEEMADPGMREAAR